MNSRTVTAFTPFRFLDLPRELRDEIYEAAIFDLSPPDMVFSRSREFMTLPFCDIQPEEPDSLRLRKMNADVLLTNRQVYWEARDVIVRARLIMVSVSIRINGQAHYHEIFEELSRITAIDPMYSNLCIMSHRIALSGDPDPSYETRDDKRFIIHRQEAQFFCRIMMGEFNHYLREDFVLKTIHILNLNCSPTYSQHDFSSVYARQTLALEDYREVLRGFTDFRIRGASIGWESGLYGAVLQDVRFIDYEEPTDLIDDLRNLEQQGSRILLQTGDVEAADEIWAKALGKCNVEAVGIHYSPPDPARLRRHHFSKPVRSAIQRGIQLRRQNCDEFTVPFIEIYHKLISHRLSGALRFIEQGHHLETRHGRAPRPKADYLGFMSTCYHELWRFSGYDKKRRPLPSDEAELCRTAAAIYRLLNAPTGASKAYKAIRLAVELVPDDLSIQQEKERVETWVRRLVDDGALARFPDSSQPDCCWYLRR